jgi:hypothetical protein
MVELGLLGRIVGGVVVVLEEDFRVPFEASGGVEDIAEGGAILLEVMRWMGLMAV